MGWLGLDWGNVPSWFSALSFSATAFVIWRDRKHRLRRQIDEVGVWAKLALASPPPAVSPEVRAVLAPTIWIRNAANLPIEIISVRYVVRYRWCDPAGNAEVFEYRPLLEGAVEGEIRDRVTPPGETLETEGLPIPLTPPEGRAGMAVGPPHAGNRVDIVGITARDASGRKWQISPRQEKGPVQVPDVLIPYLDTWRVMGIALQMTSGRYLAQVLRSLITRRRKP